MRLKMVAPPPPPPVNLKKCLLKFPLLTLVIYMFIKVLIELSNFDIDFYL